MADIVNWPITTYRRWKNRLGRHAVECVVSGRWLQFPKHSDVLGGEEMLWLRVMTGDPGKAERQLCFLAVSKRELEAVLRRTTPRQA